jgi:uncharacterized membrane protein YdjX (TVP38/TMEM64 family)
MRLRRRHIALLIAGVLLIVVAAVVIRSVVAANVTPESVRTWIRSFGYTGPVVFVLLLAFAPLVFVPGSVLTAAAGLAYGWQLAILLVLLGNNLCANMGFWIARKIGQERFAKLAHGRLNRVEQKLGGADFKTILSLRVMPIAPFQLINYGAGISSVRWCDFFWATLIGTLPGTFFYTYIGSHLHWQHPQLWFALGALFLMSSLPYLRDWFHARHSEVELRPHWTWSLVAIALVLWGIGGFLLIH